MGAASLSSSAQPFVGKPRNNGVILVVHGGAGTMSKEGSTEEQQEKYREALRAALRAGQDILISGGEAMDAAVAAVSYMEDCPLFNSARGAVFNTEGRNELESSIMLSRPPISHPSIPESRRGFALTLLTRAKNPIQLARALYLSPSSAPHATLSGHTAEDIGVSLGQELVDPSYYFTLNRWREHRHGLGLPDRPYPPHTYPDDKESGNVPLDQLPTGTVGAVALDSRGCIACATSTGGRTNKLPGRVGDTPQFSSGFFAHEWKVHGWVRRTWRKLLKKGNRAVGISGTGDGDYFIRQGTALTIMNRMKFRNESVTKAARAAVEDLAGDGGIGGVIALDDQGQVAMPLNCPGMYRGMVRGHGKPNVAIFNDDILA